MPPVPTSQISLHLEAVDAGPDGPAAIEQFAQELRTELTGLGVRRVEQVAAGEAPEGTRSAELLAVCGFVITVVQTGEALTKLVHAVRALARRYAQVRRAIRLTLDGQDVDLTTAGDEELGRVVRALLARPAALSTGVRSALVVANDRYDDPRLAQLRSPGHDAAALVRVLGDPAVGGFDVELLENADERTLRRRIAAFFADRDRDDVLLLHFSCHGVKDVRGRLHLAARDTDLSVLGATAIPASFVNDLLADSHSRRVVLILDCCYSGAFARGTGVRSGSEVLIADEFGAGSGRIVLTASSATEYAFEGTELTQSEGQPSAFTGALVGGLESGAADLDADGEITIDELYDYTYRTVRETTPGQAPMKWSFGVEGNLVIARSVRPAALPEGIEEDLASDRVVLRLEAVRVLSELLRGAKPGVRAAARSRLSDIRGGDDSARVRQAATVALESEPAAPGPAAEPATSAPPPVPDAPPSVPQQRGRPVTRPSVVDEPAPSLVDVPEQRRQTGLAVAAAVCTVVSIVSYIVVNVLDETRLVNTWYTQLIGLPELVAAVALLATRRPAWAGLLAGLMSWDSLFLGIFLQAPVRESLSAWPLLILGMLTATGAQFAALVIAARSGFGRPWPRGRAAVTLGVIAAAALTAAALVTSFIGGARLVEEFNLSPDNFAWARILASLASGLTVPFGVLAVRGARSTSFLLAGWLAAALSLVSNYDLGGYIGTAAPYLVIELAAVTTALGYLIVALLAWSARHGQPRVEDHRSTTLVHPAMDK
jgi:hypothetical protein